MKKIKWEPYAIKTIGVYKVCFEDRFCIGRGNDDTKVFVGLGTDGLEVAVKRVALSKRATSAKVEKEILNKPNLVRSAHVLNYRFYYENEQYAYIVTDLQEETLKEFVQSNKRSLTELHEKGPIIMKQILFGIQSLHEVGILHRDLHPENVLINFNKKVVLADFGICRYLKHDMSTHYSTIKSVNGWVAGESLPNDDDDDDSPLPLIIPEVRYKKSSDIQVLGMLFYFVLTKGRHPFGKLYFDQLSNIRKGVYNLSQLNDPVPKDLIEWMLHHDPNQRPTVEQCLKHPYLVSRERNLELLIAVGNVMEISKKDDNSIVVKELNNAVSLTIPPWRERIDSHFRPARYSESIDSHIRPARYSNGVTDLLRFIRNTAVHWNDRRIPASVKQRVGKPHVYFLKVFPTLPMIVHRILRKHPSWYKRDKLNQFF